MGRGRVHVGINGLGRLGRVVLRTCLEYEELELVAVNDPIADCAYICYLIKHDSTHGKFRGKVVQMENGISVNDRPIRVFHNKSPRSIPWHEADVDYVIESSGMFTSMARAAGHLEASGVKRVIITAPSNDVPMILLGVNQEALRSDTKIISCASSTLYCLAPIVKVLDENFGMVEGLVTSIHAMTPTLKPLDSLCSRSKHYRDHRGILQNIIPATTSACKSLGKIMPHLKNKLSGLAYRVPIVDVSVLDLTIRLQKNTNLAEIKKCVEAASISSMKDIIIISDEESVSSDFIGEKHSCVLDTKSSIALNENFFKLVCWYENEYSYACRVAEMILFADAQAISSCKLVNTAITLNGLATYPNERIPKLVEKSITKPNTKPIGEKQRPIQSNILEQEDITSQCTHDHCKTLVIFNIPTNVCQDQGILSANSLDQTDGLNCYPEGTNKYKTWDDNINTEFQNENNVRLTKSHNTGSNNSKDLNKSLNIKIQTVLNYRTNNEYLKEYSENEESKMVSQASSVINIPADGSADFRDYMRPTDLLIKENNTGFKNKTTKTIEAGSLPQNTAQLDDDNERNLHEMVEDDDYFHIINDSTGSSDQELARDVINTVSHGISAKTSPDVIFQTECARERVQITNKSEISDEEISDSQDYNFVNGVESNKIMQISAVNASIRCIETKFKSVENLFEAGMSFTSLHERSGIVSIQTERKVDLNDKVESASDTDSENSFQVNERKSMEIKLNDVTDSFDELEKLDKICRIIEISDDLSDSLFSKLREAGSVSQSGWSVKEFCDKIDIDDFIKEIFRKR